MAPIRVGIIGLSANKSAAWAASAHVGPLQSAPLTEYYTLTALGTSTPETAKAAAKAYSIPENKAYSSGDAIANDPDVDMVVVSVKTPLHKNLTIPALKAKKTVFVEWPLGNGLAEAEELAQLAKAQGVKTVIGLQARLDPTILKAKEIIDSGSLGRITHSTLVLSSKMLYELKDEYINDPSKGANWTTIVVAHAMDPLLFLLGEFKSFNATSATTHPQIRITDGDGNNPKITERNFADSVTISGILESGASVSAAINTTTPATPDSLYWIISGEKGSLKIEGRSAFIAFETPTLSQFKSGGDAARTPWENTSEDAKWEVVEVSKRAQFGGIGEVYEAFATGKTENLVDFDLAVKRHKFIDAVIRSSKSGERVSY